MGWKVSRLWTREIPCYRVHVERWWRDLKAGAWADLGHSTVNLGTEFFRCFAYTLGHVGWLLVAILIATDLYQWISS